jgi:YebC/PmpR family DNA-binding regulatory protein
VDAKRGKIFTKLIREVEVSARMGGGDPGGNSRLRDAISEARANNMPKATVDKAIKRGTGEIEGKIFESVTYEGYGPKGVAIIIESLTDNRNRTVAEIRLLMGNCGGNLGESGSVAWIFDKKGVISVKKDGITEEELMEKALEAGAEDIVEESDTWDVLVEVTSLHEVKTILEEKKIAIESAIISAIPKNTVKLEEEESAKKMIKLMEGLEDLDDVQKVYANFDIDEKFF